MKAKRLFGTVLAAALLLSGCARADRSIPQTAADAIRKKHPAPYTNIAKADFDAQAEALARNWNELEAQGEASFALCRFAASLGDEHTQAMDTTWYNVRTPYYAMAVEGQYVLVQGQECVKPYLGWTFAAIGGMPISEIEAALLPYISAETDGWRRVKTAQQLSYVAMLKEIGATDSMDMLDVTLKNPESGEERAVTLETLTEYAYSTSTRMPLADTLLQGGTYRANLLEDGTLFIQYNQCDNDEEMPMKDFAAALKEQISTAPEKVIVDLRHNGGGDSRVIEPLTKLLETYKKRGSQLYVLIGGETFSSAVMNAEDLREIGAVLVGETTGGTIGFGELNMTQLSDTLYLFCSTKDFAHGKAHEPVEPDVFVPQSLSDFESGVDTAVQAVLAM